jgi:hypothetical protein
MHKGSTLRLQIPNAENSDKYFSFRLKTEVVNERASYPAPSKMLLLSDIEGNFLAFRQLLIKNKVIDRKHNWIYGDGHLVVVGDCFDRGEQVVECLWLIYSLEENSKRAGGYVHFILGNHEIMNLNSDWRYIHPKYAKAVNDKSAVTALYDGNNTLWKWLISKNIIEKIGDILVVHGGISPEMNLVEYSVEEINRLARPYYVFGDQDFEDRFLQLVFNSDQSPFWYRGYYKGTANEAQVDETLAHFGVRTIVTGHTIVNSIGTYFDGKVVNINTNHAVGNSEALLIKGHHFYKVNSEGKRVRLK